MTASDREAKKWVPLSVRRSALPGRIRFRQEAVMNKKKKKNITEGACKKVGSELRFTQKI